jgi:hypothetical protein
LLDLWGEDALALAGRTAWRNAACRLEAVFFYT